ncbi:MAG: CDP-archaeol synthase [Bdellovibrionales bacterium]|nr:CDP-archaeol synthase [Bdellovibrionales bacterium]
MELELKKRLSTAGVLVGIILLSAALALLDPNFNWIFLSLGFIAVAFAAFEFASIQSQPTGSLSTKVLYFLGLFLPQLGTLYTLSLFGFSAPDMLARFGLLIPIAMCFTSFLLGLLWMMLDSRNGLEHAGFISRDYFLGLLLIGFGGCTLIELAILPGAPRQIIWFLLVVCMNDSAAYFVGKTVGGPKLAAKLSPGKTVSGSVGGLLAGTLIGAIFYWLVPDFESYKIAIVLSFLIVIAAQLGDLAKSFIKRVHGVKDSGSILPGHGGVLDRIDGLLAASPVLYLFLYSLL